MPQDKKDFFISYTSADRQWAEWIAWHLEDAGYSTVIQAWDFRAGGNFILEMHHAVIDTGRTIAVLSERYQQALYTQPEWAAALVHDPTGKKRLVVPVRIEDVKPEGLFAPLIYIDLAGLAEEPAKEKLLADIRATMSDEPVRPKTAPNFPGHTGTTPSAISQPPRFPGMLPAVWNVPLQRNPNFTGREAILTWLHEQFGASAKQIIHGMGGVGKSQIANEYCYRNAGDYDVVWWLRAEEEPSLIADFTALATALNLPEKDAEEQEVVIRAVRQWLDRHDGWLLIFDNARNVESLRGYLPQGASGHALITSRNPDWRHVGKPHEIVKWLRPDSVAFLQKRTGKDDPAAADGIANELGDLPLALEQAGAYICAKQKSLAEYLADFQQFRTELWKREKKPSDYPDTVATTWLMAFKAIEDVPLAKELLLFCSVVAPDNIPKSLVKSALEYTAGQDGEPAAISNFTLDDARGALCSYSLLTADTDSFSIHRLVQTVAQDRTGEDEIARYRAIMLKVLNKQFPREGYNNPAFWPECEQLLAHAEKIAEEGKPMVETATLLNSMGSYYHGRTFYAKAEPLYRRSLQIREDFLGSGNPDVATNLNNLASLLKDQGKYGEAEPLHRRALKIREEQLGGGHPDVAQSLNNLASLLQDQGKYGEAEPLYRRSLKIREGHFGNEHPDVAGGLNNLAGLLRAQGMYAEAEPLYRRSLTIWEDQLGSEHPVVAISLNNFALLLYAQGKYTEAEPLYRRSMKIWEEQLGGEHPNVAASLNNLGGLLKEQGKYAEAEALFERAVQICENVLGESHPNTITAKENLAVLWKDMSKG
ncbi:tetratricopeptide repeat protein [Chlorobaculum thiosulfatiphilum]|uniref:Tetratricopeptide repeat protein n=1 Tax=Chlorobaculum thiosulfatiphilum TaxID=115852 RepID=A0A5C4SA41_CHLTI|nr:FxSxx-COOH system tetratricopeptide repeat protein [Chlorobaculum thiosulfatiphilum]TNJ40296.1 tetratricopeptide repeat protein [Chlorobaculum thiosulfatiphilum]